RVSARPCSNARAGVQRSRALQCGVGLAPYITTRASLTVKRAQVLTYRAATHQERRRSVTCRLGSSQSRVRTARLQTVIRAALSAADPDERRAPGLHSLVETSCDCSEISSSPPSAGPAPYSSTL